MRIGVSLPKARPLTEPAAVAALAKAAEEMGFSTVWVSDHVLVPSGVAFPPRHQLDALALLGWLAARTERVAIGVSVLILPYRDPISTAKALSTIDWLSGGRLVAGVGVGWLEAEFDALGIPFAERGARTDEAMRVLRNLWETEESSFAGRWTRYSHMASVPKASPNRPAGSSGQGTIPLLVGGNSAAAIRRAARLGDGWHPLNLPLRALEEGIAAYQAECSAAGRPVGRVIAGFSYDRPDAPEPRRLVAELPTGVNEVMLSWEAATVEEQVGHWRGMADTVRNPD